MLRLSRIDDFIAVSQTQTNQAPHGFVIIHDKKCIHSSAPNYLRLRDSKIIGGRGMNTLLVVDDDEAMRRLIRLSLAVSYKIVDTGEPEHALALALWHKPDAMLSDLRMPKSSGFELCQRFTACSSTQ